MDKLTKEEVNHIAHLARIGNERNDERNFSGRVKKIIR